MSRRQSVLFLLVLLVSIHTMNTLGVESNERFIDEWLVLGAFTYEQEQERLAVDFLQGEHNVIPYDGAVTSGKIWKKLRIDYKGKLDFITQGDFGDTENTVCYAHAFIRSPTEHNAFLLVGSDDAVRIYVNGIDVHYHEIPRGWRPDQDTVMVRLGIGWNRLTAKVANGVGDFALSVRLVDEQFEPLRDIQSQSENPAGRGAFEMISVSPHLRIMDTGFSGFSMTGQDLRLELFADILNLGTEKPAKADVRLEGAFGEARKYRIERHPYERILFQFTPVEIERLAHGDKRLKIELVWDGHFDSEQLIFEPWDALKSLLAGIELRGWTYCSGDVDVATTDYLEGTKWVPYTPDGVVEIPTGVVTFANRFILPPELIGFPLSLYIPEKYEHSQFWINRKEQKVQEGKLHLAQAEENAHSMFIIARIDSLKGKPPFLSKINPTMDSFSLLSADAYWAPVFTGGQVALIDETASELLIAALREDKSEFFNLVDREARRFHDVSPRIKENTINVIGNAHIDMAWLWPWSETVDVCQVTFERALKNMEHYPDFLYAQSQAQAYAWMEERHPELFERIRKRVEEGRWIIVGGTWVEPDNNLPSGESQVRQILYGKRYFKEKFGFDVNIGWIPDSFGYAWTLPQIYRKSGFKYFVTQKLTWNDTNEFPYKVFHWQSPDGSRLFCYFPYTYTHDLGPRRLAEQFLDYHKRTGLKDQLVLYGTGDHGGGPSEQMIDRVQTLNEIGTFPTVRQANPQRFLDNLEQQTEDLPVCNDELYLEYHRGCYTTQALIKERNRRCEMLLETAEKLASFSQLPYPAEDLEKAWKKTLFNQFHDILPGSCIPQVVVDANVDYDWVEKKLNGIISGSLGDIAGRIHIHSRKGIPDRTDMKETMEIPVVVFNPFSWSRSDIVKIVPDLSSLQNFHISDQSGIECVHQEYGDTLLFFAKDVPPLGYKTYWILAPSARTPHNITNATGNSISSQWFQLDINPQTGNWARLYDRKRQVDVLEPGMAGNVLQAFEDVPEAWDAWNIGYTGRSWNIEDVESIEIIEQGPLRARMRIVRTFGKSRFIQDIILYNDIARIDVENQIDWHEDHILLKAAFPVNVRSDVVTCEIPYGTIDRKTMPVTSQDSAKFEISAHKWIDMSDGSYGVGLLNDSKYGHDVRGNMMRITLLRSPKWPDPGADMGHHSFTYSLYPHAGDWREAQTHRRGYELNCPLIARIESPHTGELPPQHSFVSIEPENVVLSVAKKAEDSENLIVRFYELCGTETRAEISLPLSFRGAHETDLLENLGSELEVKGNTIYVPTKPYEIKTITVEF
ncbi:MAG: alpha-mannosidase [Gemmatimonadota bacterium]|nr:MAG: alpha-mannosidase [Gemmatimonadota bacterium]